jgi:hypothetical protein
LLDLTDTLLLHKRAIIETIVNQLKKPSLDLDRFALQVVHLIPD